MSSINAHYTFNYSQPDSYRFSHDSVFLARKVFELEREHIASDWRVLDLCAGCGIVGMDFLFHCQKELGFAPKVCDFLEVQPIYEAHFNENMSRLQSRCTDLRFLNQNYTTPTPLQYDLILCNPPYFKPAEGIPSPNEFKSRCRFFIDASQDELLAAIEKSLAPKGRAYVLTRNAINTSRLNAQTIGDIRGTSLVLFTQRSNDT